MESLKPIFGHAKLLMFCFPMIFFGLVVLFSMFPYQTWLPGATPTIFSTIRSFRGSPAPAASASNSSPPPSTSIEPMTIETSAFESYGGEVAIPSFISPAPSPQMSFAGHFPAVAPASEAELRAFEEMHAESVAPEEEAEEKKIMSSCDIFDGKWVYDPDHYPLYEARRCPFLSDQVTCRKNGRPDSGYEHWRWEPRGCKIPRFNATDMMERLRGKKVAIVGDSLNRNQWESLLCLLYCSIADPSRAVVRSISGTFKSFVALDYNCTVEFFWSPFLVDLQDTEGGRKKVLKLDWLPKTAKRWRTADVLVFNTGHWWKHRVKQWDYLEHKGKLTEGMKGDTAFRVALKTWASWVDREVDHNKTTVFFRSVSPEHKEQSRHWCYNQSRPISSNESYVEWFPKSMVSAVEETLVKMAAPVRYLNITRMSEYRRDAHAAVYTTRAGKLLTAEERRRPESFADCSHWCLPGLPDIWNELLYGLIVRPTSS